MKPYERTAEKICRILRSERQRRPECSKGWVFGKYAGQNADKLLKNTNIAEYIKQLAEKAQDDRIMTAKERQALLSDIAKDEDNAISDRIKAVDTLNKMTGEYTVKVDTTIKTSEKLSDVFKQLGGEGLEE